MSNGRRARGQWLLDHPVAAASVTGGAFGMLFGGATLVTALVTGAPLSTGLVAGVIVVGALAGPPFGFLFMKEFRPLMEAQQSGLLTNSELLTAQWRREHERVRRHPWFWLWLGPACLAYSFANAIYRVVDANTVEAAALYTLFGLAGVLMGLYLIALWRSPVPPWRRH